MGFLIMHEALEWHSIPRLDAGGDLGGRFGQTRNPGGKESRYTYVQTE